MQRGKRRGKQGRRERRKGKQKEALTELKQPREGSLCFQEVWDALAMNTAISCPVTISSVSSGIFLSLQIPVPAVLWYQE